MNAEKMAELTDKIGRDIREARFGKELAGIEASFDKVLAELRAVKAERDDLRDAIRLMIGIKTSTPFGLVPQSDVDGWLERIRQLKKGPTP